MTTDNKQSVLTDSEMTQHVLADPVLQYNFALNGGAGPVSKKGVKIFRAIEQAVLSKLRGAGEPSNEDIWQMWKDADSHVLSFARSLLRRYAAPQASAEAVYIEGGRESVDDALAVVDSFGPGIEGLNDNYARQVILATEVRRLRGIYESAVKGRQDFRSALRADRQQRGGDVVAVLAYRSNGRRGVHGQTIGADGSGDFVVLYRGDEFAALVKANEEIRTLEAAGHRLSFAAIVHGEGYSGPVIRHEYVDRAALAATKGEGNG